MSWSKPGHNRTADIMEDTAFIQQFGKLKGLHALEVTYDNKELPFHVTPIAFQDGFGKLSTLRVLKLKYFGVYLDEKQEVMKYLDHIPVVQIMNMAYLCRSSTRQETQHWLQLWPKI